MEQLYSPWRMPYVTSKPVPGECAFCRIGRSDPSADAEHLVVHRAAHHYLLLNLFPYATGHLLVVPFAHEARLGGLADAALVELAQLAARVERLLGDVYGAQGINFGMNLGRCAGAGIDDHLHLHAVPRWGGDTNFMTVTAGIRVLPEDLGETWRRMRAGF